MATLHFTTTHRTYCHWTKTWLGPFSSRLRVRLCHQSKQVGFSPSLSSACQSRDVCCRAHLCLQSDLFIKPNLSNWGNAQNSGAELFNFFLDVERGSESGTGCVHALFQEIVSVVEIQEYFSPGFVLIDTCFLFLSFLLWFAWCDNYAQNMNIWCAGNSLLLFMVSYVSPMWFVNTCYIHKYELIDWLIDWLNHQNVLLPVCKLVSLIYFSCVSQRSHKPPLSPWRVSQHHTVVSCSHDS